MTKGMTSDDAEAVRTRLLTWYAALFAVWAGALCLTMAFLVDSGLEVSLTRLPTLPDGLAAGLIAVQLVGFVGWAGLFVGLTWFGYRVRRDPALRAALEDERIKRNQTRAFALGFWFVIGAAALAIPLDVGLGVVLTAKTYALGLIWIGVTAALSAFVLLERRDAA